MDKQIELISEQIDQFIESKNIRLTQEQKEQAIKGANYWLTEALPEVIDIAVSLQTEGAGK